MNEEEEHVGSAIQNVQGGYGSWGAAYALSALQRTVPQNILEERTWRGERTDPRASPASNPSGPTGSSEDRTNALRIHSETLAKLMRQICPAGQELNFALADLEQAVLWAVAAIARNK